MKLQRASVLFLFTLAGPFLHAAPRVIAPGNPPLTDDMAGKAAGFFEWLLEVRFTPAQQQEYERRLARDWANPTNRKSTLDLLRNVDKLGTISEDRRQEVRASVLDAMRKSTDEDSRWLFAIYNASHRPATTAAPPTSQLPAPEERWLVGKWRSTKVGGVQYRSSTTGVIAPTNGSSFFYQFNADGTYQYNGLMQITTYGCTTSLYGNDSGRYHVSGDRLIVEPEKGTMRTQQNCGSTGNTEKPAKLDRRESIIHFETESNGNVMLVLGGVTPGTRPDYFRPER